MLTVLSGNKIIAKRDILDMANNVVIHKGEVFTIERMFVDDEEDHLFTVEECDLKIESDSDDFEDYALHVGYDEILTFFE